MATITTIKNKISLLDAGSFQILCDSYLSKEGYPSIVALGTQAGTQKTTRGTPDTYFRLRNDKYVFVEYTTQKDGLIEKIRSDIKKCLDTNVTKINTEDIAEIIYCHTSSNISPQYDKEFHDTCSQHGIMLTIIGIDRLSEDLCSKYQTLAKEHLSVTIDTEQIQTRDEFVRRYDANSLSAPLDIPFLFRENEIKQIEEIYKNVDVVILSGPAGTGKTKLALQYAQMHGEKTEAFVYCVRDRSLPIHDDLCMYLETPGKYFIVVDDANQLSTPELIVDYVNRKNQGYNVQILITVRDYAIDKVKKNISHIAKYEVVSLKAFTDDEIKSIVKATMDIKNDAYLERIVQIAEGNARMAILAGKLAKDTNRLDSIDDVSQLYSEYYGRAIQEAKLEEDSALLITSGIIAFLNAIHLEKIDHILPFLSKYGITQEIFISSLYKLHEYEIVDIYHDKAVRFSEQCLANFILKHVFYDKKMLSLAGIIRTCFLNNKSRVIFSINTLLSVFREEKLREYVENEIKKLWDELACEGSEYFMEYVKAFFPVNLTETLIILDGLIDKMENVQLSADEIDTQNGKNYRSVDDDIITILGGFANTVELDCALDLFFKYYLKRPDMYIQFYHACDVFFGIRKDSWKYGYYTTTKFLEKITEYSSNWTNEHIVVLFLDVAKVLLGLYFTPAESNRKNDGITIYNIFLGDSKGVENYRKNIWVALLAIAREENRMPAIKQILDNYGSHVEEISYGVIANDATYIIDLITTHFCTDSLSDCLLVRHLEHVFSSANLKFDAINSFLDCEKMFLYTLLEGPTFFSRIKYEERAAEKKRRIIEYFANADNKLQAFLALLEVTNEAHSVSTSTEYAIENGLEIAIGVLSENDVDFSVAMNHIVIFRRTNLISPFVVLPKLFEIWPTNDVYEFVCKIKPEAEYDCWMYSFFSNLPEIDINESMYQALFRFLLDNSDKFLANSRSRNLNFLEKFNAIDADAYIKGTQIIFAKREYSSFVADMYLQTLFNPYQNEPKLVVRKFREHIELLEDIYIWLEIRGRNMDSKGVFFFEINEYDSNFLAKYIDAVYEGLKRSDLDQVLSKLRIFFQQENYCMILDSVFVQLISLSPYPIVEIPEVLERLIVKKQGEDHYMPRIDSWIKHCIRIYAKNQDMMRCLFEALTRCSNEQRIEYIQLFLENNPDYDDFKALPLTPRSYSCTGSAIPLYSSWVDFLNSLLPFLVGLKFIKHKRYIQQQIERWREMILREEIANIMEG